MQTSYTIGGSKGSGRGFKGVAILFEFKKTKKVTLYDNFFLWYIDAL